MGGRHSKRSVDINSTPKKDADGGQVTEKLEKIEEGDVVKVQNGHAEPVTQEGEEAGKEPAAEVASPAGDKSEAPNPVVNGDGGAESAESTATSPTTAEAETPATPDQKEEAKDDKTKSEEKSDKKKKEKSKKKWSFRSISFSRKDKTKPSMSRDESKSNDLAKEAPVPEEGTGKSEEASPSGDETAAPTKEEASNETTPAAAEEAPVAAPTVETPKEPASAEASALSSADIKSIVTSVAESGVQKVVEETTKIMSEANEAVNTIVETASKTVVEEIKSSTTITEACSITKVSSKTIEIVEETVAPPLPASPPPTEAPPPTPVAPQPIQQHEHEEMNGGGEGMAEMPEENGLCENEKIDDDPEHELPKMNGHTESPIQQVEELTECLMKTSIEEKVVLDNHLEIAVSNEKQD